MSLDVLLEVMSDGKFHSGTDLGSQMGISRAAVWKQLQKVQALGLPLRSVKARGYCLEGGLELLAKDQIFEHLEDRARGLVSTLDIHNVVESTNTLAIDRAVSGQSGYVVTAEHQTAGRGRRGRNWVSPYGSNIYLSAVWQFDTGASSLEGLSLATGVSIVAAMEQLGVQGLKLKWPNDVLYAQRKLAGVLIEITGDAAGPCQVALGVGLNVRMPQIAADTIEQPWTDLDTIRGESTSRNQVLALLLNQVMPMLQSFGDSGFRAWKDRWQSLDAHAEKDVTLEFSGEVIEGKALGVDDSGAIILRTKTGTRAYKGGELTLRTE